MGYRRSAGASENDFDLDLPIKEWLDKEPELHEETLRERILQSAVETYQRKEEVVGAEMMRHFEKGVMLQTLDSLWKEHLAAMDYLRRYPPARLCAERSGSRSTSANRSRCLPRCWSH